MIEIRATQPDEFRANSAVVSAALLHAPLSEEEWEKSRPSWDDSEAIGAWDGDRCVGTMAAYRFDTLVPGGAWLRTAGVTRVAVLPTHRRAGLARALMARLLTDARERGQVLASLRATEALIYPRFGFGLAGDAGEVLVVPAAARPFSGATTAGTFRILSPGEVLDVVPPIYECVARRPGVITRPAWMWRRYFKHAVDLGGDAEYVVVHMSAQGVDDGFAHYKVGWHEERFAMLADGRGEVYDLIGADATVELALWEYLCNVDLVREWYAEERPCDDPARLAAHDPRAYQQKLRWDEQWLRLLDVDAALAARTYNDVDERVTVAVDDPLFAANCGVWEISPSGAKRASVGAAGADLAVDVRELAATYLGGVWWSSLAAAGRVDVRRDAALTSADRLFVSTTAPFCGSGF
jgi:predicted acetyltransferase